MNHSRGQTPGVIVSPDSLVTSEVQLAELYRAPSRIAAAKKTGVLDEARVGIIERSLFVLVATSSAGGSQDVSPRGGPPGFVRVLDDRHVALPDLNGNNLIDRMRGVVTTGRAALLVLVPGKDETLRINGQEQEYADDLALDTPES